MKIYLAAALVAALSQPASAITFASLTTIYVGTGVVNALQSVTIVHCSNVSGVAANLRFLILDEGGTAVASHNVSNFAHGAAYSLATFDTAAFTENFVFTIDPILAGTLNVESTQSGVFCTAKIVDFDNVNPAGFPLSLVRVNPHPGTVE